MRRVERIEIHVARHSSRAPDADTRPCSGDSSELPQDHGNVFHDGANPQPDTRGWDTGSHLIRRLYTSVRHGPSP